MLPLARTSVGADFASGGEARRVTDNPERDDFAQWHPDGAHLVAVSERRGQHDLYLFDAND
jgi:Tol biopolymer transport system component